MKKIMVGNHAVSWGAMLSRAAVISAYPITPQTTIVEELSVLCADGTLKARFVPVESEHSAMACCVGASAAGVRAFTATSSQGLALMHEMLHWASGARLPIVMANVNRALGAPYNIWGEQSDSLAQRDTGWLQLYCENNQEVLDTVIQAFKIAEEVLLPVMVVLDALPSPLSPGCEGPPYLCLPGASGIFYGIPVQDAAIHAGKQRGLPAGGRRVRTNLRAKIRVD
jgi:pyruvate/2-oxoacid:ferredoxin oxidoreductase alpha subunit